MRYWDSSAIIPLLLAESNSARLREILELDSSIVTWWGTLVECASAFARLERDGNMTSGAMTAALIRARGLASSWAEVGATPDVREQSIRLLRVHRLRAADAIQLAAAIVAADFQTSSLQFVTLDRNQAVAAEKEGFSVLS